MSTFYDANIIASAQATVPPELAGGIVSGAHAPELCKRLREQHPRQAWYCAIELTQLVGADDPRFPNLLSLARLDLRLANLESALRGPVHAWFALAETAAQRGLFIHLDLPPGTAAVAPLRKLAANFPRTRFWIDPFIHGPERSWEAQVRAAELENIWLSTQGLPGTAWTGEQGAAALHFTMGEVGASKLLLASGANLQPAAYDLHPARWLAALNELDADQLQLVTRLNFQALFSPQMDA